MGITQALSKQPKGTEAETTPPEAGSSLYGKWHHLFLDETKMLHELDANVSDSNLAREVDQPRNEHDIQLWACLLEFAHRRMGHDGIVLIWQSVFKRRNLFQVDGLLALRFWKSILDTAVSDENMLRDVVIYAEWLYQTHGVRWPELYFTIIAQMLQSLAKANSFQEATEWKEMIVRWHFALTPSFSPGEDEFIGLMKTFIASSSSIMLDTLRSLYSHSPHRRMYDMLIPHLYAEGYIYLAMKWRLLLLHHNDIPVSLASRPFLRFMAGYFTKVRLTTAELKLAGLGLIHQNPAQAYSEIPQQAVSGQNLSYLINRVHGETFGITEKSYNDKLGSKWFASSWVSLDFAINVIYTMGVQAIGPLSLQSIALREEGAPGVLRRIEQLRQLKIGLPKSNYVKAIRHYASVGDNKALQELLQSDIHPDVFDNEEAQDTLLRDCLRAGDWDTYKLVLRTRLAVLSNARAAATDLVLESCVRLGNGPVALRIMQEMAAQRFELAPVTSHMLSGFILQSISPHADNTAGSRQRLDLHIALARHLAATRFPPAVQVWQTLLHRLGAQRRLANLERLSFLVLRLYAAYAAGAGAPPAWAAHVADVPPLLRAESPFAKFQLLPRGLPLRHALHPLRQIFDANLQNSIVRWGFLHTSYNRMAEAAAAAVLNNPASAAAAPAPAGPEPETFHMARGIRLLAMLRDGGLLVLTPTVRKQAELRLADLFRAEGRAEYKWPDGNARLTWLRRQLRFSLAEAKTLCDAAWGKAGLVPSLVELERKIFQAEKMDQVKGWKRRLEDTKNPAGARARRGRR